jgi:hypothetical protein
MKIEKFSELNEGFFQKIKNALTNEWEKLAYASVTSPYRRSTLGFTTDEGEMSGKLWIYVERKKKKIKAEADYGEITQEFDIDDVYVQAPELEKVIDWALSTDISKPLKDIIKEKFGLSFINLDDYNNRIDDLIDEL